MGHLLQLQWFARVALAQPSVHNKAPVEIVNDLGGADTQIVSHTYARRIRDAFVEVLKGLNVEQVTSFAQAAYRKDAIAGTAGVASSTEAPSRCVPFVLLHLHDEAALRLRSHMGASASASEQVSRLDGATTRCEPPHHGWRRGSVNGVGTSRRQDGGDLGDVVGRCPSSSV